MRSSRRAERPSPGRRLALFGLAYCGMHVGPVFLRAPLAAGLTTGDGLSLLAPYVVLGSVAYVWLGFDRPRPAATGIDGPLLLLLAAGLLYTSGHGINLSANAIARMPDLHTGTPAFRLTYFLDEHLGHVLWHLGVIGLTGGLLWAGHRSEPAPPHPLLLLGAPAFAFAYFTDAVEGQTVPLMGPAALALLVTLFFTARGRSVAAHHPVRRFFIPGLGGALLLLAVWAIWQGGVPQFSEVWDL